MAQAHGLFGGDTEPGMDVADNWQPDKRRGREVRKNVYDYMEEMINDVPIGAHGVMYHPYLLAGGERAPLQIPGQGPVIRDSA